jgi:hypothetical protein
VSLIIPFALLLSSIFAGILFSYFSGQNTGDAVTYLNDEVYFILNDIFRSDFLYDNFSNWLFWLVAGASVYVIGWAISVAIIDGYNDLVQSKYYIHPRSFHNSTFWAAIVGRLLLRTAAVIGIVGLLHFTFTHFIPTILSAFVINFESPLESLSIVRIVWSLLFFFIVPYSFTLILRLLFLRHRVFSD